MRIRKKTNEIKVSHFGFRNTLFKLTGAHRDETEILKRPQGDRHRFLFARKCRGGELCKTFT
jgi:hypothetical protein